MSGLDFDSIQAVVAAWQQQQQQQLHLTSQLSNATFIQHHGYRVPLPQALAHQGRWYIESGSGNARPSLSPNFVRPPHHFIRHPTAPAPIRLAGPPTSSEQIQPPHRVALQAAQLEGTRSATELLDAHTHVSRPPCTRSSEPVIASSSRLIVSSCCHFTSSGGARRSQFLLAAEGGMPRLCAASA